MEAISHLGLRHYKQDALTETFASNTYMSMIWNLLSRISLRWLSIAYHSCWDCEVNRGNYLQHCSSWKSQMQPLHFFPNSFPLLWSYSLPIFNLFSKWSGGVFFTKVFTNSRHNDCNCIASKKTNSTPVGKNELSSDWNHRIET